MPIARARSGKHRAAAVIHRMRLNLRASRTQVIGQPFTAAVATQEDNAPVRPRPLASCGQRCSESRCAASASGVSTWSGPAGIQQGLGSPGAHAGGAQPHRPGAGFAPRKGVWRNGIGADEHGQRRTVLEPGPGGVARSGRGGLDPISGRSRPCAQAASNVGPSRSPGARPRQQQSPPSGRHPAR